MRRLHGHLKDISLYVRSKKTVASSELSFREDPVNSDDLAHRVSGVAALAEPSRRRLYAYVVSQPQPVSRDQASADVGIARHTAKFHLDKLVDEGLLETEFKRLSGRRGPGAGRPTKLYKRSDRQLAVTLPERRYDLAGQLMAQAIDNAARSATTAMDELEVAAGEFGARLGEQARGAVGTRPSRKRLIAAVCVALAAHGYEPRCRDGIITLANCPFDALAREHTQLVCGMNLALLTGVADGVGGKGLAASLNPTADRCCVVLAER
jgi:predicted ArsR family transcriptional regulator